MDSQESYEDFVARGLHIREQRDSCSWGLGDLANQLKARSSELFVAAEFARDLGLHRSTLSNYQAVASFFDVALRKQYFDAPYTFYRLAMRAFPDNLQRAIALIELALDNNWSCDKMANHIQDQHPGTPTKIVIPVNGDVHAMAEKIRDAMPDTYRTLGAALVAL